MRLKIAVIMPEIFSALDYEFLNGIYKQSVNHDCDILILTGIKNSMPDYRDSPGNSGKRNIYSLLKRSSVDGVILSPGKFMDQVIASEISDTIQKSEIPCIVADAESSVFPYIYAEQSEYFRQITRHLTDCHGCRKFIFLSGIKGEYNSEQRQKGFEKALSEAGIGFSEDCIRYGCFWKAEPERLASEIASGTVEKPDAVICANDMMAVALCEALEKNGLKIPEDIKVTGYDGEYSIISHMPSLTTVTGNSDSLGQQAFCRLYQMITGTEAAPVCENVKIRFGTSCGCTHHASESGDSLQKYISNVINHFVNEKANLDTDISEVMICSDSVDDLSRRISDLSYQLGKWKSLDVCLCEDWKFCFQNPSEYRTSGFSDSMISITTSIYAGESSISPELFSTDEFTMSMGKPHNPRIYIFTSLHSGTQIFGYLATSYDSVYDISIGEHYAIWCGAISNGLKTIQENEYREYINRQVELLSVPVSVDECLFSYSKQLSQLRRDIYSDPQKDWSIENIQKQLGISRSHLQRLYKAQFSTSCTEDVINARIIRAKHLLKNTDLNVCEIASMCGYNDDGHFMRQFKKRTGITALRFRKNI